MFIKRKRKICFSLSLFSWQYVWKNIFSSLKKEKKNGELFWVLSIQSIYFVVRINFRRLLITNAQVPDSCSITCDYKVQCVRSKHRCCMYRPVPMMLMVWWSLKLFVLPLCSPDLSVSIYEGGEIYAFNTLRGGNT